MVCLDSDILIDFLNNKKEAVQKINELKKENIALSITSVNSFELLNISSKEKLEEIRNFLFNFRVYNFDFESSENAAQIFQELKSRGAILDLADIMIAAIALSNNETLITRNIKHFERIKELKIEKW